MKATEILARPIQELVSAYKEHSRKAEEARVARAAELAAQEQVRKERITTMQAEDDAAIAKLFSLAGLQWREFPRRSASLAIREAVYFNGRWGAGKRCLSVRQSNPNDLIRVNLSSVGGLGDSELQVVWQDNPDQIVAIHRSDHRGYVTTLVRNSLTREFEERGGGYDSTVTLAPDQIGRFRYANRPGPDGFSTFGAGIHLDLVISNKGITPYSINNNSNIHTFNRIISQKQESWGIQTVRAVVSF